MRYMKMTKAWEPQAKGIIKNFIIGLIKNGLIKIIKFLIKNGLVKNS